MLSFVLRLTRVSSFTKKVFWFIFCNVKMFQWIAPENIHTFFFAYVFSRFSSRAATIITKKVNESIEMHSTF